MQIKNVGLETGLTNTTVFTVAATLRITIWLGTAYAAGKFV
jgi:hypothetical protein